MGEAEGSGEGRLPRREHIKPRVSTPSGAHKQAPGGTPRGWSFYSTAHRCWRLWCLRYIIGLTPLRADEYFTFGSTYHALHEGVDEKTIASWGPDFVEALPAAKELYSRRIDSTKNPPLPPALAKEQTYAIPVPGAMSITTKPDQEEAELGNDGKPTGQRIPRDYKTAGFFSKNDSEYWAVSGQIIAEMIATGASEGVVDIIHKGTERKDGKESDSFGKVQQLQVLMTEDKRRSFFELIRDLSEQIDQRLSRAASAVKNGDGAREVASYFPRCHECVGHYGLCPYYDRCWTVGASRYLYRERPDAHTWLEPVDGESAKDMKVRKERALAVREVLSKVL